MSGATLDLLPAGRDPYQDLGTTPGAPAPAEPRLYLITRRDLPWSVRIVQVAHAATMLLARRSGDPAVTSAWAGPYGPAFVVYGTADEAELLEWERRLGSEATAFREPDLGEELTAIAYLGGPREGFEKMRLL